MPATLMWFRRDLRLADNPALSAALAEGDEVVPLFVLDDRLRRPSGPARLAFLYGCLRELDEATGGRLVVRTGEPAAVVPAVAAEAGAAAVFCAEDFGPYGRRRDEATEAALGEAGVALRRVGSPYAVAPGTLRKADGTPFKVYTPFARAWAQRAPGPPQDAPAAPHWAAGLASEGVPGDPALAAAIPPPGEAAGRARLGRFLDEALARYAAERDAPGREGTSRLSAYLKYGCVHPRQVLGPLPPGEGGDKYRSEVAWRDFYADVLFAHPESHREPLQAGAARLRFDDGPEADRRFAAWAEGRTGYPIVDAGMRQLQREAWVHNRVRLVVASFLVKDLHLHWRRGARHFMSSLVDGDLASNYHGWQWVAGTGTDPAPFFRIFNPVSQGQKFDPDASYVRRYVPELAHLPAPEAHEPWKARTPVPGYPDRIVDHAAERADALARYAELKGTEIKG